MRTAVRRATVAIALFILILFAVFLLNQTAQLVLLGDRVSPLLGTVVLWSLIAIYAACLAVPAFLFLRFPKALAHPAAEDLEGVAEYRRLLARRLEKNPHLAGRVIDSDSDEGLAQALAVLGQKADEATKRAAAQTFVTTAISQNGSLDAVVVLAAQSRLVFEVARIYNQRPSLQELAWLYGNVAGTAFVVKGLEEIDISEHVQPLMSSVAGSAIGALPGFQVATSAFINSVMSGSANAFLTLRIGMIAKQYCASIEKPARGRVRRSAVAQATRILSGIVVEGTRRISGGLVSASTRPMRDAIGKINDTVRASASAAAGFVRRPGRTKAVDEPIDGSADPTHSR